MKLKSILIFSGIMMCLGSCKKFSEYDNLDVIEATYTGDIVVTAPSDGIESQYSGTGDSGSYCFIWRNRSREAVLDMTASGSGTIRYEFEDARGNIVLNETVNAGDNTVISVETLEGPKGNWFIKVFFTEFSGEGTFELN